ncbi:MAG: transcriptional repressor [Chromatiales bacterium]|nr:transcriptional repressor [Gammaproteobacteria bacterium]MBW6477096.1 transcriptional repressor [Chromatiales bacterium]
MSKPAFLPHDHNHQRCIDAALAEARAICQRKHSRLTPQREQVLRLIWQEHRPIGAYELLDKLREEGLKAAPPTVYRALEFLQENGLIHRIESLNAYTGCSHPSEPHASQFLVCQQCQRVAELGSEQIAEQLSEQARRAGFASAHQTVEIRGTCAECLRHFHV